MKQKVVLMNPLREHIAVDQTITLPAHVIVTDPCYDDKTWCQAHLKNMKPGIYHIDYWKAFDRWDGHAFVITHENYKRNIMPNKLSKEDIGMDAGMVGVYPIDEFHKDELIPADYEYVYGKPFENHDKWYSAVVPKNTFRILGTGFTSNSGYGDGSARLYYDMNSKKEIIRIAVLF